MLDIVLGIGKRDIEHIVATASGEIREKLSAGNIEHVSFDSKRLKVANPLAAIARTVQTLRRLIDIVAQKNIDLVVTNTVRMHIVGVLLALITGKKLVWIVHSYDFNKLLYTILSVIPDRIVFVSESLAKSYGMKDGRGNKFEVIYNGINWEAIQRKDDEEGGGIADIPGMKIGIIGRIEKEKGHEDLVRSMPSVLRQIPDAHFILIGKSDPQKKEFKERLLGLIRGLHVEDKVHFVDEVQNIFGIIKQLDLVVQPSRIHESFGRALVEAMAMGKPVVATKVKGYTEIIQDGFNGILVPVGDSAALAGEVARVLKDKDLYGRLAANGRESVESKYNVRDTIRKYSTVLHGV